jgi:hypothetical protein
MKAVMTFARAFLAIRGAFQFLGPMLNALLLLFGLHIFLWLAFPNLAAQFLGDEGESFSTIPLFMTALYTATVALVIAAFVVSNLERRRAFMRPLLALLTGDPTHPAGLPLFRVVVLGALPFVIVGSIPDWEGPLEQRWLEMETVPKGPLDAVWEKAPAQRVIMFREGSRLSSVPAAYVRAAQSGPNVAVWVQYALPVGASAGKDELCELWWLNRNEPIAMPRLPSQDFISLGHGFERWSLSGSTAQIVSSTVFMKNQGVSAADSQPTGSCVVDGRILTYQFNGTFKDASDQLFFLGLTVKTGPDNLFLRTAWSKYTDRKMAKGAKSRWWLVLVIFLVELMFMTMASSGGTEI